MSRRPRRRRSGQPVLGPGAVLGLVEGGLPAIARLADAPLVPPAPPQGGAPGTRALRLDNPGATPDDILTRTVLPVGAIAAQVRRFEDPAAPSSETQSRVVSFGFPLRPGALQPADHLRVSVSLAGSPVAIWTEDLGGRHPDGSLLTVLVQFPVTLAPQQVLDAVVTIGGADRPNGQRLPARVATPGPIPEAVIVPTSADYLVATQLVGPTRTVAQTAVLGARFVQYDADFTTWSQNHYQANGVAWDATNYYDRSWIYGAFWARSAQFERLRRALLQAVSYIDGYLAPNNNGPAAHWAQYAGVHLHYLLTGHARSRQYVAGWAENSYGTIATGFTSTPGGGAVWDARILGRSVEAQVLAWRISGRAVQASAHGLSDYVARVEKAIDDLAVWQQGSGRHDFGPFWCNYQANWMLGIFYTAFQNADEWLPLAGAKRTILYARAAAGIDYIRTTQWISAGPGQMAIRYMEGACANDSSGVGGGPAPDLTNMVSGWAAWAAARTANTTLRAFATEVFVNGVLGANVTLNKQFNEAYRFSWSFLHYRA